MSDDTEKLRREMRKLKPRKRLAVPDEFLDTAKSYEDKQILVQMLTEKERQRVVLLVKSMLRDSIAAKSRR